MVILIQRSHFSYAYAFYFSLPFLLLIETRCAAQCHLTVCTVQTLANRASRTSTNRLFFSRGYDPYTHACKARPLTSVGRTSLSVFVIVIERMFPCPELAGAPDPTLLDAAQRRN